MKIKKILISQPEPADIEKSPYRNLVSKHGLELTFFKFFEVQGISASDFRKTRIHLSDHTAIILTSKNAVDHFFRMAKELREVIPETMKYFCATEAIGLYLQNYIQYRKRKIFSGIQYFSELVEIISKHRDEKFLLPCSDEKQTDYTKQLDKAKIKYTKAPMYTSVYRDLTHFNIKSFDLVVLFSPIGVRSLLHNFPEFKDNPSLIAAFGTSTHAALKAAGLKVTIAAPTKAAPSMNMAIENYVSGKVVDDVVTVRTPSTRSKETTTSSRTRSSVTPKKVKTSVFADKERYKQLQEERKAQAAARRAERKAEREALEAKKGKSE